jgi:hypothetical protein
MSQHSFKSVTKDEQKVEVLMGYDRPLNYVFCVVTAESGAFVYSNLSDPRPAFTARTLSITAQSSIFLAFNLPSQYSKQSRKTRRGAAAIGSSNTEVRGHRGR